MRNNLVTVFHCSQCGKPLTIADKSEEPSREYETARMDPPLPTGAAMSVNRINLHPCQPCIDKWIIPARAIANAIKDLNS